MNTNQATAIEVVKYSTQLPPELVKWVKRYALDHDIKKDYQVIQAALEDYRARREQETPQLPVFQEIR